MIHENLIGKIFQLFCYIKIYSRRSIDLEEVLRPELPEEESTESDGGDHTTRVPEIGGTPDEVSMDEDGEDDGNDEVEGNLTVASGTAEEKVSGDTKNNGDTNEKREHNHTGGVIGVHESVSGNVSGNTENAKEADTGEGTVLENVSPVKFGGDFLIATTDHPGDDDGGDDGGKHEDGADVRLETVSKVRNAGAGTLERRRARKSRGARRA